MYTNSTQSCRLNVNFLFGWYHYPRFWFTSPLVKVYLDRCHHPSFNFLNFSLLSLLSIEYHYSCFQLFNIGAHRVLTAWAVLLFFLFVSYIRLSQWDETDEGLLLPFHCHNTLPEPALKLIIHLYPCKSWYIHMSYHTILSLLHSVCSHNLKHNSFSSTSLLCSHPSHVFLQ